MSDAHARVPNIWPLGTWAQGEDPPVGGEALEPLDPFLLYPDGGRQALWLPGWDRRSVWGFHPAIDAYFALLWRNGNDGDDPDIWIHGYGLVDGRPFAVASTRMLAREIAAATGADLAAVCAAMTGKHQGTLPAAGTPNCADTPSWVRGPSLHVPCTLRVYQASASSSRSRPAASDVSSSRSRDTEPSAPAS